jgi:hypothetical protein
MLQPGIFLKSLVLTIDLRMDSDMDLVLKSVFQQGNYMPEDPSV